MHVTVPRAVVRILAHAYRAYYARLRVVVRAPDGTTTLERERLSMEAWLAAGASR
jgi:hypothetical protein